MVIRTPDQRLRVFVSSSLGELADERRAVARAISALRLTPVMFELGARPYPPRELYRAYLAQSDVFIGLYWQRYGWIGPGREISGLEDEYDLARGLPRLLYVKKPAPGREPRLAGLLDRIRAEASASYRAFRRPAELARVGPRRSRGPAERAVRRCSPRGGRSRTVACGRTRAEPAAGERDVAGRAGAGCRGGGRARRAS